MFHDCVITAFNGKSKLYLKINYSREQEKMTPLPFLPFFIYFLCRKILHVRFFLHKLLETVLSAKCQFWDAFKVSNNHEVESNAQFQFTTWTCFTFRCPKNSRESRKATDIQGKFGEKFRRRSTHALCFARFSTRTTDPVFGI